MKYLCLVLIVLLIPCGIIADDNTQMPGEFFGVKGSVTISGEDDMIIVLSIMNLHQKPKNWKEME